MTSEATILRHAKAECKRLGLRFHRMHYGPGSEAGWPDVEVLGPIGHTVGLTLRMETKAPGKALRPIQKRRRDEIRERGGMWCKPDTKGEVTTDLEAFARICLYRDKLLTGAWRNA